MSTTRYFYLKPEVLSTSGFCYGASDSSPDGDATVHVRRLASGRWIDLAEFAAELPVSAVRHREVSEQEALSGVGSYVGSCVCVAHRWDGSAERWTYG
ncbi:hypothetical protein PHYSODRAFT_494064 [Phytophthora sojae]|uniref:Uncharacterized protein n=1 Tax=Phytophthora sojae (strain P6497) TaxID=1094619 RepID=G4Z4G4_PHYSP|nr:hypothetical protein PHYSODRAFT_494064 [Phytophthora sojae]EGZ20168.1 hypothetical protein PHYSODRAFT_494064 [Phytophthora sojae]|eukprot:XP_009522885.1 hypothetical protein PHYSODRAFT_494064 [Phytophthora sojae]